MVDGGRGMSTDSQEEGAGVSEVGTGIGVSELHGSSVGDRVGDSVSHGSSDVGAGSKVGTGVSVSDSHGSSGDGRGSGVIESQGSLDVALGKEGLSEMVEG